MQDRGSWWGLRLPEFSGLIYNTPHCHISPITGALLCPQILFILSLADLLATLAPKPGKRTACKLSLF